MSDSNHEIQISANLKASLDNWLIKTIEDYLKWEKVKEHKYAIKAILDSSDIGEINRLFGQRLQFGTAGIRGSMGPGYNQMNDLVVIQTAQGIVSYLSEIDPNGLIEKGVIIGNDARHNSHRFARLVALAFLQKGVKVYFNDHIVPTPFIAFGTRKFGCIAGIMVTASHNPKEDNGIKVYWFNGAQILSPNDKNIQNHILKPENQEPWSRAWEHTLVLKSTLSSDSQQVSSTQAGTPSSSPPANLSTSAATPSTSKESSLPQEWIPLLKRIYYELKKYYFDYLKTLVLTPDKQYDRNKAAELIITFTPMHGVGYSFMDRAFEIGGFDDRFCVENQKKPNPDFTSVPFPNPEENGALHYAFETAKHTKSNLILANDPDSDRCAAALYDPITGYRRILNGNEIGSLLGWWLWHSYLSTKEGTEMAAKGDFSKCYMISTAVSSKFLSSMAAIEGFNFVETLTGFKYMGNLTDQLVTDYGAKVIFAYEEAIGYMVDSTIYDKDGISAALQVAQCAAYCFTEYHRNLEQQLNHLYQKYGYHFNLNSYYICNDKNTIEHIFTRLQRNYPKKFNGGYQVRRTRDLNNNFDSATTDHKAQLPSTSSSFMVTFFIDNDICITFRTSGTEPKIKYYSEIVAKLSNKTSANDDEKHRAQKRLATLVNEAIEYCLKPKEYNLLPAA